MLRAAGATAGGRYGEALTASTPEPDSTAGQWGQPLTPGEQYSAHAEILATVCALYCSP